MKNLFLLLVLTVTTCLGQQKPKENTNFEGCGSDELHWLTLKENPAYKEKFERENAAWSKYAKANPVKPRNAQRTTTPANNVVLTVAFHNMVSPFSGNTTIDYQAVIDKLNAVYSGLTLPGSGNPGSGNDTGVQFCLAKTDILGNEYTPAQMNVPTTIHQLPFPNGTSAKYTIANNITPSGAVNRFPSNKFINIYVVDDIEGPTAGFSSLPSAHGSLFDGFYMERAFLTSPVPKDMIVMIHEMGHYLGLYHVFGVCDPFGLPWTPCYCDNTDCTVNGDMVCDTDPIALDSSSSCTAPTTYSCSPLIADQRHNYMDYSNWSCLYVFTEGQVQKMQYTIDPVYGPRRSLLDRTYCADCSNMNLCDFGVLQGSGMTNGEVVQGNPATLTAQALNCANAATTFTYTWELSALVGNTTIVITPQTNGPGFVIPSSLAVGNYRIKLRATASPNCFEDINFDFQVVPQPPVGGLCLLSAPNSNWDTWQRASYTGGWSVNQTSPFDFTYPTTVRTTVPVGGSSPNFEVLSPASLSSTDTNFSAVGTNGLPATVTSIFRVGRKMDGTPIPDGSAAFTSVKFKPTKQNCKYRIYYLGITNKTSNDNGTSATTFGFSCRYNYKSPVVNPSPNVSTTIGNAEGGLVLGTMGSGNTSFSSLAAPPLAPSPYGLNDMYFGQPLVSPITGNTETVILYGSNSTRMTQWRSMDIDFSEFVDAAAEGLDTEITITFFAKSDIAVVAKSHSYAYFGIECLGGDVHKNYALNLQDISLGCGQACATIELPLPPYALLAPNSTNIKWLYNPVNMGRANVALSYDPNSFPAGVDYSFPSANSTFLLTNICIPPAPDNSPFIYCRVTVKTLHQTVSQIIRIYRGALGGTNPTDAELGLTYTCTTGQGGAIIGSHDIYICSDSNTQPTLTLGQPCFAMPPGGYEYRWMANGQTLVGNESPEYTVNPLDFDRNCNTLVRQVKRMGVSYCGSAEKWINSEVYSVYKLEYIDFDFQSSAEDICINDPFQLNLTNFKVKTVNTCSYPADPNNSVVLQLVTSTNDPLSQPVSLPNFNLNAAPGYNTSLSFQNMISTGVYNFNVTTPIRLAVTFNFYGCTKTKYFPIILRVKASAVGGTISQNNNCVTIGVLSANDGVTTPTGYYEWQISNGGGPFVTIPGENGPTLSNINLALLNPAPAKVRRVSFGTPECPGVVYSNVVTLNPFNTAPVFNSLSNCGGTVLPTTSDNGITGTWNPTSIPQFGTTTYTFTPTAGQCSSPISQTITSVPKVSPIFNSIPTTVCGSYTITQNTSDNGIPGTWSFTNINPAHPGSLFTPLPGYCAYTYIHNFTILPGTTPVFSFPTQFCLGGSGMTLPTTSNNGVNGVWSPATVNTAVAGTTNYVFTANNGNSCSNLTVSISVGNVDPIFAFQSNITLCNGATAPILTSTSLNNISGTWSPAVVSNTVSGTYTFTPSSLVCNNIFVLHVTVLPNVTPTFTPIAPICYGNTINAANELPTVSDNGISGVWSPSVNNLATTTYTFTSFPGQCAANTQMTIVVNPQVTPTFNTSIYSVCVGVPLAPFPTVSNNGIQGYWEPSVIDTSAAGWTNYTFHPTNNNCAEEAYINVQVIGEPEKPKFDFPHIYCRGANIPPLPGISEDGIPGTWSPPVINNNHSDVYTFTPSPAFSACVLTVDVAIEIVDNPPVVPQFDPVGPVCLGETFYLPPNSLNDVQGFWTPAIDYTTTTTYTFTPTSGICANPTTMTVVVNPIVTPTFDPVSPICRGTTLSPLPLVSTNGISGYWSPGLNNQATTTYVFTPNSGQCAVGTTLTIEVIQKTTPSFTPIPSVCIGAANPLPSVSNNNIAGTWSPAFNSATTGSTTYTFTPSGNECANTATLTVIVIPNITPTFSSVSVICAGNTLPQLPSNSNNGITGTWAPPTMNNQATTTYVFTPNAGQCANTKSITITVNPKVTPTFSFATTVCSGTVIGALPTTSTNGITGTWSPAVSNVATTTYTFTPTSGQCANTASVTITITPKTTPTFTAVAPICQGSTIAPLPTTSNNGITGTWAPALNNSVTTTYTFTPTSGQCANTTSMVITVTPKATPTFSIISKICAGANPTNPLPTTSGNGIVGTWSPAFNNQATTLYTFTPNAGQCANTTTATINVSPIAQAPTAASPITYCQGATATPLTANGIAGGILFWQYALSGPKYNSITPDTSVAGQTTYYVYQSGSDTYCQSPLTPVVVNVIPTATIHVTQPSCSTPAEIAFQNLSVNGWTINTLNDSGTVLQTQTGSSETYVINNVAVGVHHYTVISGGCTSSFDIDIHPPSGNLAITPKARIVTKPDCDNAYGSIYVYGWPSGVNWTLTQTGPTASDVQVFTGSTDDITIENLVSGVYTYTISYDGLCESTPSDPLTINPSPIPSDPVLTVTQPTCTTLGSIAFDGLPDHDWNLFESGNFLFSGHLTTTLIENLPPGDYSYSLQDAVTGCFSAAVTVTLNTPVVPDPPLVISPITYTLGATALPLTADGVNLTWYFPDNNPLSGTPTPATDVVGEFTYFVTQTIDGCESDPVKITVIVTNPCENYTEWDGTNWSNGAPDLTSYVVIRGDYDTNYYPSFDACRVLVISPYKVTVTANNYVNIDHELIVSNGGAAFEVKHDGSLVQIDNDDHNVGNISYERSVAMRKFDYVYWSSPIRQFNVFDVSPTTLSDKIFYWNPTALNANGTQGNWILPPNPTNMEIGKGYIIRGPQGFNNTTAQTFTATFQNAIYDSGTPNNGIVQVPVARGLYQADFLSPTSVWTSRFDDNQNLIGNPYPSAVSADKFLLDNTNIEGMVSFWSHGTLPANISSPFYQSFVLNYTQADYIVYNGTGTLNGDGQQIPISFDGYIAAGQGFFVTMLDGPEDHTQQVFFDNSMRDKTYDNTQFFRNSNSNAANASAKNRIWLDLANSSNQSMRTLLGYVDGATYGKDRIFDAPSSFSGFEVYSLIDNDHFSIQGRPTPFDSTDKVAIGINVTATGNYKFALTAADGLFNGDQAVYIEDKLLNTYHNLKQSPYTFSCNAGRYENRFRIVFELPVTPTFEPIATICEGASGNPLPLVSTNGISGTWSPVFNNMLTTTYTFMPNPGEYATTAQLTIPIVALVTYYQDLDNDGYGNANTTTTSCTGAPVGYVNNGTDCDDTNATVYPGAPEVCFDGIDNDCNGVIDNVGQPGGCTPIVTSLTNPSCGVTVTALNSTISATAVSGAQGYRFKVTNMASGTVEIIDRTVANFSLSLVPNVLLAAQYKVEVAVKKFNVWQPFYGAPCFVYSPNPSTQLSAGICNSTLASLTSTITANIVANASGYCWEIQNMTTNVVATVQTPLRTIALNNAALPSGFATHNTVYTIRVAARNTNGVDCLAYGPSCTVTTPIPVTQLTSTNCNITLSAITNSIFCTQVAGMTNYHIKVVPVAGGTTLEFNSATNSFNLNRLGIEFDKTYSISVAVYQNNGVWVYGAACNITTPALPPTTSINSCGAVLSSTWNTIYIGQVTSLVGIPVTGYRVELSDPVGGTRILNLSGTSGFNLRNTNFVPYVAPTAGTTYTIRIALLWNGVYQAYGPACTISTAANAAKQVEAAEDFNAWITPNPFSDAFNLGISPMKQGMVNGRVYDMMGKLIDTFDIEASKINDYQLGRKYPAGVYTLVLNIGESSKSIRIIKR